MTNILDNASIWHASRHAELQEFSEPEPIAAVNFDNPEPELELEPEKNITNTEVRNNLNLIRLNEPTAQIVTTLMDTIIPVLLVLLLKGANEDQLKLNDDEKETLTQAWAQYLKDSNVQMSPGVVLLGSIAIIYGAKITLALSETKKNKVENNELIDLKKEIAELKKQIPA